MTSLTETAAAPVTEAAAAALKFTNRINRIEPSATMAGVAEADKLRQAGVDGRDLRVGAPGHSADQDDHPEFAVDSHRRGDVARGFDRSGAVCGGAGDLGDLGRDLCLSELQQPRVFARVVAGAA